MVLNPCHSNKVTDVPPLVGIGDNLELLLLFGLSPFLFEVE